MDVATVVLLVGQNASLQTKQENSGRKKSIAHQAKRIASPPLLIRLRETYLAKVEERLQRMERAMAKSELDFNGDAKRRASDEIDHRGGIHDKLSMLKINSKGSTAFVGR